MFKAMILLKRREDNSIQDFRSWWIGEHAPLARQLPGVRRICFNVVESEDALYDGISELSLLNHEGGMVLGHSCIRLQDVFLDKHPVPSTDMRHRVSSNPLADFSLVGGFKIFLGIKPQF